MTCAAPFSAYACLFLVDVCCCCTWLQLDRLGDGSFGRVVRCVDERDLSQEVAIKLLPRGEAACYICTARSELAIIFLLRGEDLRLHAMSALQIQSWLSNSC